VASVGLRLAIVSVCVKSCVVARVFKYLVDFLRPPDSLQMFAAMCGVGGTLIVQIWCGHVFVMDGTSHSWHVQSSARISCSFNICLGRHRACIHRRHISHWMRSWSLVSPFPSRQWKHGG